MDDTSPYVRELKTQHAAEVAKQEARIAELELERDSLDMLLRLLAMMTSDQQITVENTLKVTEEWAAFSHQELADKIKDAIEQWHDHEASFDVRWKADCRAIKRWREATGREMVSPDQADLCVWLMEQWDAATTRNAELTADLKAHMHLVRTMGERCDLLGGLVRRWIEHENGAVTASGTAKLIEDSERALAQGGSNVSFSVD